MSDIEIERFKALYLLWLSSEGLEADYKTGVYYSGGLNFHNYYVKRFYWDSDFILDKDNSILKVSHCSYSKTDKDSCQSWGGNSGGPIFDSDNNIMGITTRGWPTIGSDEHASFGSKNSSVDVSEIIH